MAWASNSRAELLLDFESTYAESPTGSDIAAIQLPFNSCDLKEDQAPQQSNVIGAGRVAARPFYSNKVISGTLTGPIDLIAIGYILRCVFGAPTTTGSTAPYTHVFKPSTSTPSFLLDKGFPDATLYYLYNGLKATGLSIGFTPTGQLQYSMSLIGAKETKGTSPYQASPSSDLSLPATILNNADAAVSEGGSSVTDIEEVSFNFQNNSVIGYGLNGSGTGTLAAEGAPTISGTIKAMLDNDTILAKGRDHTESSLSVALTSGSYSLTLAVNELEYSHESPPINGPAGAYCNLSYVGYYQNHADAAIMTATLVNTQASYA